MKDHNHLLEKFVNCFFDDECCDVADEKIVTPQVTSRTALDDIYSALPGKFPLPYERLVLNYRWRTADLGILSLIENPPGDGLHGLLSGIQKDKALFKTCSEHGYIQFAFAAGGCYDPVCFDIAGGPQRSKLSIVQLDHEKILCYSKTKVVSVIAQDFEELVTKTLSFHDSSAAQAPG